MTPLTEPMRKALEDIGDDWTRFDVFGRSHPMRLALRNAGLIEMRPGWANTVLLRRTQAGRRALSLPPPDAVQRTTEEKEGL